MDLTIIKQGNPNKLELRKFCCPNRGCEFIANCREYEAVCSSGVLDAVVNGERILLIDRATESINSLDEISTKDLAIAIKDENKDNRYEFYKEVKANDK